MNDESPAAAIKGVRISSNNVSLVIRRMTPRHQGLYICTAANYLGVATTNFDVTVSDCQPSFTMLQVPECMATILITLESPWMANDNRQIIEVMMELETTLKSAGIGTGKRQNKYAVVGFGTEKKARIVEDTSGAAFFDYDKASSAVSQLRRDGQQSDGYQAILYALKELPLETVRYCVLHILLATDEPRTAVEPISMRDILSVLCKNQPLLMTAFLSGGFVGDTYTEPVLGVDSNLFSYISETGGRAIPKAQRLKVQPAGSTICRTFSDYGALALRHNGSVWDLYSLGTLSSRESTIRAMADVTVRSSMDMKPCRECPCKKNRSGHVLKGCSIVKQQSYCNCRDAGQQVITILFLICP